MELHEAVKKARKELGLTQQKLAQLAGIERKQLSILENGGNVTLATIRKIVAHLPNMQPFTIGQAVGKVIPVLTPEAKTEMEAAAEKALGTLLRNALSTLEEPRWPTLEELRAIDAGPRALYRSAGFTDEEYEAAARMPRAMTTQEAAEALAKMTEAFAQLYPEPKDKKG